MQLNAFYILLDFTKDLVADERDYTISRLDSESLKAVGELMAAGNLRALDRRVAPECKEQIDSVLGTSSIGTNVFQIFFLSI
jgi:hypothetical protein